LAEATSLRLYSRPGCHLCEEMASALLELDLPFDTVNIEQDADAMAVFADAIPVLKWGDIEVARAPQSQRTLKRALQRAGVL